MSDKGVELSVGSSSSNEKQESDNDNPSIVINDQKEVHMKVSSNESDHSGSITTQEAKQITTDQSKDPKIKPEKNTTPKDAQSQCCLLI